jgi:hypothetical protein
MKCDQIKEQIYEWSKGTLSEKDRSAIEEHLQDCRSCQSYVEQVKNTLALLDEIMPPPLSAQFTEDVLQKARSVPLPEKPVWERFKEWFQVPYVKWPLEALATAAVILIAVTVYKDFSLTKPSKIEMTPRSFQVEISDTKAKHPIIILTMDLNKTLSSFEGLIKEFNGRIIQTLPQEQEIRVSFNLKKEKETAFFNQLNKLGPVQKGQDGFRDDAGNMVVVLKLTSS